VPKIAAPNELTIVNTCMHSPIRAEDAHVGRHRQEAGVGVHPGQQIQPDGQ